MKRSVQETEDAGEWRSHLAWVDPADALIRDEELHWNKITKDDAVRSFRALEKMRPYLGEMNLFDPKQRQSCRDSLSQLRTEDGEPTFNRQELGFFDLYFGGDKIKVARVGRDLDVTNGRHRLWLARQTNLKELPVLVEERIYRGNNMSTLELADIEKETREQHEEAEEMENQIERHRERAAELKNALETIRAASSELVSDQLREGAGRHRKKARRA